MRNSRMQFPYPKWGETGYKKVMYRGANFLVRSYDKEAKVMELESPDKHLDGITISGRDIDFLKLGWR